MLKKLKQWYTSKTDKIRFALMQHWTNGRGLSIVQIVTINGTDFIATGHGTFREISKVDLVPTREPDNDATRPDARPTVADFTV